MEHENRVLLDRILSSLDYEEESSREFFKAQIKDIETNRTSGNRLFSLLLEVFVHLEIEEEEALRHWESILDHHTVLANSLRRHVGIHVAITDYFTHVNRLLKSPMLIEIQLFKQTEQLAMMDGLTGIFNRRYMDLSLKKEMNRSIRYEKPLSIIIMDIDDFKKINDRHGHVFGDLVLKEAARFIKETVREEDIACRYGGEEFLVILPETLAGGAFNLAERIRQGLRELILFRENGITISGGTATFPESAPSQNELVAAADRALYRAKYSGKNRVLQAEDERRRFDRYPRVWDVDIRRIMKANGQEAPALEESIRTHNVSMGGIRFEGSHRYDIDDVLSLTFDLARDENDLAANEVRGPLCALAKILWVRKHSDGSFSHGASFLDLPVDMQRMLSDPDAVENRANELDILHNPERELAETLIAETNRQTAKTAGSVAGS